MNRPPKPRLNFYRDDFYILAIFLAVIFILTHAASLLYN